jgi:hypothetical protein
MTSIINTMTEKQQMFLKKVMDVIITYMHIHHKGAKPLPSGYYTIQRIQHGNLYNETDRAFLNELARVYKTSKAPTLMYTDTLAVELLKVLHI